MSFFPNGQCRHYQLVDGWAKVWCIRTDPDHVEHETAAGVQWAQYVQPVMVFGDPGFNRPKPWPDLTRTPDHTNGSDR